MSIRKVTLGSVIPLSLIACGNGSGAPQAVEKTGETHAALTTTAGQIVASGGLCLNVVGNNPNSGASLDIEACNGGTGQAFDYSASLPGQPVISGPIVNPYTGLCLDDVFGAGQALQMVTCMGTPEQTWTFNGWPGSATLTDASGHCLDVPASQTSGSIADPAVCNQTAAQNWSYTVPPPTITVPTNGPFSSPLTSTDGLCLDVVGDNPNSGAAVDVYACNGSTSQTFTFNPAVPGPVVNTASGMCLDDVFGAGQDLQMVTCSGTPEQTWTFNGWPDSATMTDAPGHCVDILGGQQRSGQPVDPAICNRAAGQNWSYVLPCAPGRVHGSQGMCACDTTNLDASVSAALFNLWVAPALSTMTVTGANNVINVNLPSSLKVTPPAPIDVSIPNVTVNSVDMPSGYTPPSSRVWDWSMSADSATITVTTTLDASVTVRWGGVDGVGACTLTARILFAPVTFVLADTYSNYTQTHVLQVQSVSIPLRGGKTGNTMTAGCVTIPQDDVLGILQSKIEGALQGNLNGQAFMAQFMDAVLQQMASNFPNAVGLPSPQPASPGFTWGCGQASMTTGAIGGRCSYECD
jgi:hypothetical protein